MIVDIADSELTVLRSISSHLRGFLYRCANDADYTMEYLSPSFEACLGHDPSAVLGNRLMSYNDLTNPDDIDAVVAGVDRAIETRTRWDVQYRLRNRAGQWVWVQEIGGGVFGPDGELLHLEGVVIDISEARATLARSAGVVADLQQIGVEVVGQLELLASMQQRLRLVSINARIEAARSGGGAFSTIAKEVRDLATDSIQRATEIAELLTRLSDADLSSLG